MNIIAKFFSLRKSYDFVPWQALQCVLQKYGVPDCLVDLLHSFYDGMAATVSVGGEDATPFEVRNILRQGCTIALTSFILYFIYLLRLYGTSAEGL